ncbi:MAG: glycosyltransferase family 39 protein, partial [Litorimonas sp.]
GSRPIWAQRLPSVFAGLLAVWLTYVAGAIMLGRMGAVIAGSMLATSLIFVFEAHIAKTDALLLASTTAAFLALMRLRDGRGRGSAWLFWGALGVSMMIKGPVGPSVAVLALIGLLAWERRAAWLRPLLSAGPILLFLLLWVPWVIAINAATDGAFLAESLGRDLGGKIAGAQESHGAPPGYYALTILISLWPASLFLLPGLVFGWRQARGKEDRFARLCLAWIVPFWLLLELAPTKLIHYPLPLFPALCLLMAGAVLAVVERDGFARSRRVSVLLFALGSAAVTGVILAAQLRHGAPGLTPVFVFVATLSAALSLFAGIALWRGRALPALAGAGMATVLLSGLTYAVLLPNVEDGRTSQALAATVPGRIASIHYTEPSLVYYAGTERVRLGDVVDWEDAEDWRTETLVIDRIGGGVEIDAVRDVVAAAGRCLTVGDPVTGFKYSNFEAVDLLPVRQVACES